MQNRFFEISHDMLCVASAEGQFTDVNPSWTRTLGWTQEQLTSKPFVEFVHPDDRDRTYAEAAALNEGMSSVDFRNRYQHANGEYRWIDWRASRDAVTGEIYAAARDVTEFIELLDQLRDRELVLTRLVNEQMRTRESEQQRIAGELHDSVVQHCVAALMFSEDDPSTTSAHSSDVAVAELATVRSAARRVRGEVRHALEATRKIMQGLDPLELGDMQLDRALESMAAELSRRYDVSVTVEVDPDISVDSAVSNGIFRMVREGLVNAAKHAEADSITLDVRDDGDNLVVSIADDGCGIGACGREVTRSGAGLGLSLMNERVRAMDGTLQITSSDAGTTLSISVPHRHEEATRTAAGGGPTQGRLSPSA